MYNYSRDKITIKYLYKNKFNILLAFNLNIILIKLDSSTP